MRSKERDESLLRSPKLIWNILFRGRYDFEYDLMPVSIRRMSAAKRWNLFKAGTNLIHRRLTPWNMPLHMQIEPTNYCNLRCSVCPLGIGAMNRCPVAMDVDLLERLIDQVGPYLLTISLWAWGEPLLHPNLVQILRAVRKYDIAVLLSTNGQNLNNDRVIETLVDSPPTFLIVAIDGLTDETNSRFRVGAKLDPVLSGVRRLAEIKRQRGLKLPVLHMRYIVMKHNQHELPQLPGFAERSGFDLLTVRMLAMIDCETPDRVQQAFAPDIPAFKAYAYKNGVRIHRDDFICQEPFWFPSVLADGTVVACEQDYNAQQPFGVLADGVSFADLWFSKHAAHVRKIIRDNPETLSFCQSCPCSDRPTTSASIQAFFFNRDIQYPVVISRTP